MKMKCFIAWAGDRGSELGKAMKGFLETTLGCDCFYSPESIDKGKTWFSEVSSELDRSDAAVICLTPETVQSRWMHFEAGAIFARTICQIPKEKHEEKPEALYTYFLGRNPSIIQDPFKQLQTTISEEADTRKLVEDIASQHGLDNNTVAGNFGKAWEKLAIVLRSLETPPFQQLFPEFQGMFERKTFDEPINECPDFSWIDRYLGARETQRKLKEKKPFLRDTCHPYQLWLYEKLISQIDGYAREMKRFLIGERMFAFDRNDKVDLTRPISCTCRDAPGLPAQLSERRRKQIRRLVFLLANKQGSPVLPKSPDFARLRLEESADKKHLVHSIEREFPKLPEETLKKCSASYWDLDRITYCLAQEKKPLIEKIVEEMKAPAVEQVRQEVERLWLQTEQPSEMPLHYAVRALRKAGDLTDLPLPAEITAQIEETLEEVERWLSHNPREVESPIARNVRRIRERLKKNMGFSAPMSVR